MQTQITTHGSTTTLCLMGKVDVKAAQELALQCQEMLLRHDVIAIDARQVELLDVAAAQVLLALRREVGVTVTVDLGEQEPARWLRQAGLLELLQSARPTQEIVSAPLPGELQ